MPTPAPVRLEAGLGETTVRRAFEAGRAVSRSGWTPVQVAHVGHLMLGSQPRNPRSCWPSGVVARCSWDAIGLPASSHSLVTPGLDIATGQSVPKDQLRLLDLAAASCPIRRLRLSLRKRPGQPPGAPRLRSVRFAVGKGRDVPVTLEWLSSRTPPGQATLGAEHLTAFLDTPAGRAEADSTMLDGNGTQRTALRAAADAGRFSGRPFRRSRWNAHGGRR
jgi:hypothetical protein